MKRWKRQSIRAKWWDYDGNGTYFMTTVVRGRDRCFGQVEDDQMKLSRAGRIVEETWLLIPEQFEHVQVDVYQVMPDHFHGILHISGDSVASAPRSSHIMKNSSLASVMRWFKGKCTYEIRKEAPTFAWVTRYYDRILQDPEAVGAVRNYIKLNPIRWSK